MSYAVVPISSDVDRADLGVIAEPLQLARRAEQAGAVRLGRTVLADDTELDGEPEHVGDHQARPLVVEAPDHGPRQPVEFCDLGAGEAVGVAHHLVDHVGFRRVEGRALPPQVLRRREHRSASASKNSPAGSRPATAR
jgi:hypothetical protein